MIKAVLFDLDGTLANSLADLAAATNYAMGVFGFPSRETEEFKYFAGDGMPKMIERALPENHKDAKTVSQIMPTFLEYYGKHYCDNTSAYCGMPEVINKLKLKGVKIAVVTNKNQEMADKVINKLYGKTFDFIFGKRENLPAKPDPTAAFITMDALNVKPEECIFVGDSKMDVMTGVNSGAYPVGVLWGFRSEDELISGGARSIIKKPQEILAIVDEFN
ncbi:MAG: HAD family hydrolase [Clostridia bacterium]|nr:HAD family hydrolase [Clostridia bacterium]